MIIKRLVIALALFVSAAGCGEESEPLSTPRTTFEAMKAATLAEDWDALYELNAPSERKEAEARWDAARASPETMQAALRVFARDTGQQPEVIAGMTLRELYVARIAKQAEGSSMLESVRLSEFVASRSESDGVRMVTFSHEGGAMELPMKHENGRWYLWKTLTALTDF